MSAPYFYDRVTLVRIVDADTVVLKVDCGFHIVCEQMFRLRGIDAPELRRKESAEAGKKATEALRGRIEGKSLSIATHKSDKYGRYLCDLFAGGENVNAWLVDNGFARRAWED
ncbi:MAG: thermonuclease family protein [Luteolibacter sp.]